MASKRSRTAYEEDLQKQESPYVFFGTPLPPLDEQTRDDGSYVPIWKQEVIDDRGRKRLHGAFTGGFSAGYFNTVGSKEGWTPATFKSSRQDKAKDSQVAAQQRPEDFMDEEDIREAEESREMSTTAEYAGLGSTDGDHKRRETFMDIFRPTGETIGVKLLKKLGWKEGQGIGPKVRRKANVAEVEENNSEITTTHLFAPEDPPMISFNRKFDHKGLGFESEARLQNEGTKVSTSTPSGIDEDDSDEDSKNAVSFGRNTLGGRERHKIKKGAFGVGILNDTGSDEEDSYQMGPKISYNRVVGGSKKTQKKKDAVQTASNPLLKERPIFTLKKLKGTTGFRKCHDGRLPLDGFVLSTELDSFASMNLQDGKYKPPTVPEGWKSKNQPSNDHSGKPYVSTADAAKLSSMDAKARAAILGEEQMPGKSVFDFLTPAARDRIATASGKSNLPAALNEKPPEGFEVKEKDKFAALQDMVPKLDAEIAMQALGRGIGGWMPYAEDEGKRARYRAFLETRAGIRDGLPEHLTAMSKNDWVNEMHEFARAAQVFKPVTGLMASRFTSSTSHPKLASDRVDSSADGEALLSQPPARPEDPAVNAAKMGMFGPLTRTVKNFYPTRLLCKRFNVKPPAHVQLDPGDGPKEVATAPTAANSRFLSAGSQMQASGDVERAPSRRADQKLLQSAAEGESSKNLNLTHAAAHPYRADPERIEALEAERPSDDVFKAIFGSDDQDD